MSVQPPEYQPQFSLWVRQLLVVSLLVGGVFVLTLLAPVMPMLTIAFLVAFVMFVPSRTLARRTPIPYALSVLILYICLIVIVVLGLLVLTPTLVAGINSLLGSIQQGYNNFLGSWQTFNPENAVFDILGVQVDLTDIAKTIKTVLTSSTLTSSTLTSEQLSNPIRVQQAALGDIINQILPLFGSVSQTVTSAIGSVTGFIGSFLLALFISFLILVDVPMTQHTIARSVRPSYHREFALLVQKVVHVWNGFFKGQVLIGFAIGVLTFVELSALGISNTFILAVLTGTISLIPTIGGIIALIPLSLIPLIQGSQAFPQIPHGIMALLVVGINLVITQIIWNVIAPKILGDALDLPLPVIVVGVFIGAAAGGVLGAFLVAPIMATIRVVVAYLWHKVNMEDPFPNEEAPFQWGENSFEYRGRLRRAFKIPSLVRPQKS